MHENEVIAYDPNSGEKLSLKEHVHHMDNIQLMFFLAMKKTTWYLIHKKTNI